MTFTLVYWRKIESAKRRPLPPWVRTQFFKAEFHRIEDEMEEFFHGFQVF